MQSGVSIIILNSLIERQSLSEWDKNRVLCLLKKHTENKVENTAVSKNYYKGKCKEKENSENINKTW